MRNTRWQCFLPHSVFFGSNLPAACNHSDISKPVSTKYMPPRLFDHQLNLLLSCNWKCERHNRGCGKVVPNTGGYTRRQRTWKDMRIIVGHWVKKMENHFECLKYCSQIIFHTFEHYEHKWIIGLCLCDQLSRHWDWTCPIQSCIFPREINCKLLPLKRFKNCEIQWIQCETVSSCEFVYWAQNEINRFTFVVITTTSRQSLEALQIVPWDLHGNIIKLLPIQIYDVVYALK